MLTYTEAREKAVSHIEAMKADLQILDELTVEKPFGWYFMAQTRAFIKSRDWREMFIGFGGFIVDRMDGHLLTLLTHASIEEQFRWYELGYRFHVWDLTITVVRNMPQAVSTLLEARPTYVVPEVTGHWTWRIPQPFSADQLWARLQVLPCKFDGLGLGFQQFLAVTETNAFSARLEGIYAR